MKKISIFANCQGEALFNYLSESSVFIEAFECLKIAPIQTLRGKDIDEVENVHACVDVLITQVISDEYFIKRFSSSSILKKVSPEAIVIKVPNIYFDGYFPHLGMLNGVRSMLNLVHDYNIVCGFLFGISQERLVNLLQSESFYSHYESERLFTRSLNELKAREKENGTVLFSDIIENNYQDQRMFHQFNHPSRFSMYKLWERVSRKGGLQEVEFSLEGDDYLEGITCPIYPSTHSSLGLKFANDQVFKVPSGDKTWEEVVDRCYYDYSGLDRMILLDTVKQRKPWLLDKFQELGYQLS